MAWHTLADHPEIPPDDRSLVIALANLLQKLGLGYEPTQLYALLMDGSGGWDRDWLTLSREIDGLLFDGAGESGWPATNNALVQLRRIDESVGGVVDHYCLVADPLAHSVVDSLDGRIRPAAAYGEVFGWVSFQPPLSPAPEEDDPPPVADNAPKPGTTYRWVTGDTIWEVARRLGFRPLELLEHNGIDDPRTIRRGDVLHLPEARQPDMEPTVQVEVLPAKRLMHVTKQGGTRKWSFGFVRSEHNIAATGPRVREDASVDILAVAHVPLLLEGKSLDFYIDELCFGDYLQTGWLRYTIGYDPADLADGHIEKASKRELPPQMSRTVEKLESNLEALEEQRRQQPRLVVDVRRPVSTSAVKETTHPLYEDRHTERFVFLEGLHIPELDGRRQPVKIAAGDLVDARVGVYMDVDEYGDPVEYVLPLDHDDTGLFYLIPRSKLMPDAEFYHDGPTAAEAAVIQQEQERRRRLTAAQRYYWSPLAYSLTRARRLLHVFSAQDNNKDERNHHDPQSTAQLR